HAFNKLQRDEAQRQAVYWVVGLVVFGGSALALAWVYLFLRRERERELAQLEAEKAREHAEVLMLAAKVEAQEAERAAEETERKQMILRTVRRDPTRAAMTRMDLNDLIRETGQMWTAIGKEKWKLAVQIAPAAEPLYIRGDLSHLQQAIENLVFNARDATF